MTEREKVGESRGAATLMHRDRGVAGVFLSVGLAAAGLAAYYYTIFLGLRDPYTQSIQSEDYFSYVQYYMQIQANVRICAELGASCIAVAVFALCFGSVRDRVVFRPLYDALAYVRCRSRRFKTIVLAVPLVLLETGLMLYGGLMGVARSDFSLAVELREQAVIRAIILGPLAPFGGYSPAEQDYYFLGLLSAVLIASYYRFESVRRTIQIGALAIIPLPILIYLFDGIEFNTFFAAIADGAGLAWFTNAFLLYASTAVFVLATVYPSLVRLAGRLSRYLQTTGR